jgi:ribulose-5-phosphate 4-epimerase/fuculose-1-phosphate aldolase
MFNGVVLEKEEGEGIARALGKKKAALLQNHGLLTVGETIEEAVFWFATLEKCCQVQLLAEAAVGGRREELVRIGEREALNAKSTVGTPLAGFFSGLGMFEVMERETGGAHLL